MSSELGKLSVLILSEVFGESVAAVGHLLNEWNGRILPQILSSKTAKVRDSLAILIFHNLVTFKDSERWGRPEYTLHHDRVVNLLRYPRIILFCKKLFGKEGEMLSDELLKNGRVCGSQLVANVSRRILANGDSNESPDEIITKVRDTFQAMAKKEFFKRPMTCEKPVADQDPKKLVSMREGAFLVPELDIRQINKVVKSEGNGDNVIWSDKSVFWMVNVERFNQEFRDQIIVQAASRRIDSSAGNLMKSILHIADEPMNFSAATNNISQIDIVQKLRSTDNETQMESDGRLQAFTEQYLKVLEEDRVRFVDRVGDSGGGQYVVNLKHLFEEFASATIENIILEKFGSKALRIFRVIRQKIHVEESQLQGLVMIPSKETKELTYQLLENNFIQMQELRKSLSANAISKSFYLFYVDVIQVTRMLIELCYKSLANTMTRKNFEAEVNQRLLDKNDRIEAIAASIKNSGELEDSEELQQQLQDVQDMLTPVERDNVAKILGRIDQLTRSTGHVDETLFVLNSFIGYSNKI